MYTLSESALLDVVGSIVSRVTAEFDAQPHPPSTRQKRRLRPRTEQDSYRRSALEKDYIEVDGRMGKSIITGKAIEVFRHWSPTVYNLPSVIPLKEEVVIGGRRWIVKETTLGAGVGYGLFACEDIPVPANLGVEMEYAPALFPYAGPQYTAKAWRLLLRANPSWIVYQLDMDQWPGSHKRKEHSCTIDGDPV